VQLSPQRLQAIGVKTAVVEWKDVKDELRLPGNVDVNEQQLAYVQTRFPGWIQKVFANANYQYVRKGQPLFTIYSPDLVSTEQEYLLARQNQKALSTDMHGTASKEGEWLLQAAADRLRQFGVPQREIEKLEESGKVQREIEIDSPVSGYITERNALPNQYVQADTKLYTITDLSTAWVYANVFQGDIGRLRRGNAAQVTVDAYPGRRFNGRIDQILPQVDTMTRTARVRLVFSNPGVVLKPGMYVNVNISLPLGRQLVIPSSGVLQSGTRQIAFVDHGQGYLEPRKVEAGPQLDDHVVILKGLREGERIVSSANFLVDSEAQLQAAIGSFAPPPPNTAEAATPSASRQQIQIDLSTDPSPAHKGGNTIRVRLTDNSKKPIAGAQVTTTFFLPAMPAMGMAAMRSVATLADKGNGLYEGPLQLPTGGTWQVTVVAQRGGQTIATRQLSVSATGGM
jgi:Cu(I)/Ag(I) efflux system membrane fusion protein/cobalt-zinc-cadmium efflux system membrane fusion protein